jgi:hypothetical protein
MKKVDLHHPNSCQLGHGTNLFVLVLSPMQKAQQNYHELNKSTSLKRHL